MYEFYQGGDEGDDYDATPYQRYAMMAGVALLVLAVLYVIYYYATATKDKFSQKPADHHHAAAQYRHLPQTADCGAPWDPEATNEARALRSALGF